jgi:hypothetical protein
MKGVPRGLWRPTQVRPMRRAVCRPGRDHRFRRTVSPGPVPLSRARAHLRGAGSDWVRRWGRAGAGVKIPGPRAQEPHPGRDVPTQPGTPSIEVGSLPCRLECSPPQQSYQGICITWLPHSGAG